MASFNFQNLTDSVRDKMLSEVEMDIANENLYVSGRLNQTGIEQYSVFLKESIKDGNEETLEASLIDNDCLKKTEVHNGKINKVPSNSAKLIAQSEFNRFYIRAICLEAIESGIEYVEVYRSRESSYSRPESEAMIGRQINPNKLLEDLRVSIGVTPKILPDINSGLSVKI